MASEEVEELRFKMWREFLATTTDLTDVTEEQIRDAYDRAGRADEPPDWLRERMERA